MNAEAKIKELNDELRALKTAYERSASEIVIYTFSKSTGYVGNVSYEITFTTNDGSNAIASLEGARAKRVPFEGGAKWLASYIMKSPIKVHSMQQGEITIS